MFVTVSFTTLKSQRGDLKYSRGARVDEDGIYTLQCDATMKGYFIARKRLMLLCDMSNTYLYMKCELSENLENAVLTVVPSSPEVFSEGLMQKAL